MSYRPQEIAEKLGISSSTLRLWSTQFAVRLSDSARKVPVNGALVVAQRRYTDEDLFVLMRAKDMLRRGQTYDEVNRALARREEAEPELQTPYAFPTPIPTQAQREEEQQERAGQEPQPEAPAISAAMQEALEAKEVVIKALHESLDAKEKTISALKESLAFLDIYIHTLRQEREDGKEREKILEAEMEELRQKALELAEELATPAWKRWLLNTLGKKA